MKRKLLVLMALITITVGIEATSAKPSVTPKPADDYCDSIWDTCMALRNDYFNHCRDNGGLDCFCEADRRFNTCNTNWGCTGYSEQAMIERGCGPQQ